MDIEIIAMFGGRDHCAWLGCTPQDEWHNIDDGQIPILTWFTTLANFRIPLV